METIEIKIRVECDQCERELHTTAKKGPSQRDGSLMVVVEPCPECLRRARIDAIREDPMPVGDHAGMVRENVLARDEIAALRRKVIELQGDA